MAPSTPPATRQRTSYQSSSPPGSPDSPNASSGQPSSSELKSTAANLPPSRQTRSMRRVAPPLANMRLHRLIYILVLLGALMGAWYSYRLVQYKRQVGGWWDVALGRGPRQERGTQDHHSSIPSSRHIVKSSHSEPLTVEDHLTALSHLLGVPTAPLAAAIAGAVRAYVPPASLSSLAANPRETGEAVRVLLGEKVKVDDGSGADVVARGNEEGKKGEEGEGKVHGKDGPGIVDGVVHGVGSFVGMDEP